MDYGYTAYRKLMGRHLESMRMTTSLKPEQMIHNLNALMDADIPPAEYRAWEAGEADIPAAVFPAAWQTAGLNPRAGLEALERALHRTWTRARDVAKHPARKAVRSTPGPTPGARR